MAPGCCYKFYPVMVALVLCVGLPSPYTTNLMPMVVQAQTCPSVVADVGRGVQVVKTHGALSPFLSSAKTAREAILTDELPYGRIREEIARV